MRIKSECPKLLKRVWVVEVNTVDLVVHIDNLDELLETNITNSLPSAFKHKRGAYIPVAAFPSAEKANDWCTKTLQPWLDKLGKRK